MISIAAITAALFIQPVFTAGIPEIQSWAVAQPAGENAQANQKEAEAAAAAAAKAAQQATAKKDEAVKAKDDAEKAAKDAAKASASTKKPRSYEGGFVTPVLADDSVNELRIPLRPENLLSIPENDNAGTLITFKWLRQDCPWKLGKANEDAKVLFKRPVKDEPDQLALFVRLPPRPCDWPLTQFAAIEIKGKVAGEEENQPLFNGRVLVSASWIPILITLAVLALIYPGCAFVVWAIARRRYDKKPAADRSPSEYPEFWESLDPVQITANQHGRGSLAKLQIFGFSFLVFGLLLYYQLRYGMLSGLSTDVLYLMGISAGGAVAGKVTYTYKRRLSLPTWTWLVEKKWLPDRPPEKIRAKWSELVLDADSREFDPYSFQMAIFSVVVAVALVRSGLTGLGTFHIPAELLTLLGISQVVYIGGKAAESSPYRDLEDAVKTAMDKYQTFCTLAPSPTKPDQTEALRKAAGEEERKNAWRDYKISEKAAGNALLATYGDQLPKSLRDQAEREIRAIHITDAPPAQT